MAAEVETYDKFAILLVFTGWACGFFGLVMNVKTAQFTGVITVAVCLVVLVGLVSFYCLTMVSFNLAMIRQCGWMRKKRGWRVHFVVFFANLILSALPSALPPLDEKWFLCLIGFPVLTFALEWRLKPASTLKLSPMVLGISMGYGFGLFRSDREWVRYVAAYFALVQPLIFSVAFFKLMPQDNTPHLRLGLPIDANENLVQQDHYSLSLLYEGDTLAAVRPEVISAEQRLFHIEAVGEGTGGGARIFSFEGPEDRGAGNYGSFDLCVVEM